jgi:hypothetical protein
MSQIWFELDEHMNPVPMSEPMTDEKMSERWQRTADVQCNGEAYRVSTVFLALDHGFGGDPLFFETRVFGPEGSYVVERYATHDEATHGHMTHVNAICSGTIPHGCEPGADYFGDDDEPDSGEEMSIENARDLFKGKRN